VLEYRGPTELVQYSLIGGVHIGAMMLFEKYTVIDMVWLYRSSILVQIITTCLSGG
jgi:hypothetical protein